MKNKRIGGFHITNSLLGQGSFSHVYLGYAHDNTKVAVKVIPRDNIKGNNSFYLDNQLSVFEREINLLNHCKHQHIINLIDVKKTKSNFYIFLELCDEGNLAEYIAKNKKLNEIQAINIFHQLLKAMMAMKRSNIVHRDLKPANIMLKQKNIKVVDFGLATKYSKNQMLKSYSGTPLNMAPEILKGQEYNDKAQIYSAGTILYQMLFGVVPFQDRSPIALVRKIESAYRTKNYLPHWTKDSLISKPIRQLLVKMLQPNPEKRIDLQNVMIQIRKWENSKILERINSYKRLSACAIPYMGMIGGIAQMFNFDMNKTKSKSVYDMDLKVCGKLSRKLIVMQQQWLKNMDLIRV